MPLNRRRFLTTSALGAAAAASGTFGMPTILPAQTAGVKLGLLHPVRGALSYSGQQGRIGATMAVDEINAAGGIKSLNGAKIEPVLGDAQSTPDGGTAELEKMNSAEVSCVVGGYASSICLAVSQAAARYDLPYVVDVGVADSIITRGLKNTFRFSPGLGVIVPCRSSTCGRRASILCSAARLLRTSSSRIFPSPPNTLWTAITGSIRKVPKRRI